MSVLDSFITPDIFQETKKVETLISPANYVGKMALLIDEAAPKVGAITTAKALVEKNI